MYVYAIPFTLKKYENDRAALVEEKAVIKAQEDAIAREKAANPWGREGSSDEEDDPANKRSSEDV